MHRLRVTTRMLMVVVLLAALLMWGGILAWRWQHYRGLMRLHLSSYKHAVSVEQFDREWIERYHRRIAENERTIEQYRRTAVLTFDDRMRNETMIRYFEEANQDLKIELSTHVISLKYYSSRRREYEVLIRNDRAAAARPWAFRVESSKREKGRVEEKRRNRRTERDILIAPINLHTLRKNMFAGRTERDILIAPSILRILGKNMLESNKIESLSKLPMPR